MLMLRVSTLLKKETLQRVSKEAKEKSISIAAIIRQKVEQSYKAQDIDSNLTPPDIDTTIEFLDSIYKKNL